MLVFCFLPVPYLKQSLKLNWSQETNAQSILKLSYSHFDRNRDDPFEKEKWTTGNSWLVICCGSVAKSCVVLRNRRNCSPPGFPILHYLLEFAQTYVHRVGNVIQPSHPLFLPSSLNLSQHQGHFQWVTSLHQVVKVLELQLHHESFQWIFRVDFFGSNWFDLLAAQGALKSLHQHHSSKASILWHSAFFMVQLSFVHDYWRNRSFDYIDFSWQNDVSDFNVLSKFALALSSVQFSRSVLSDSLRPHESQHARPSCPSPTPGVHPDSCPLSQWCHPAISSSQPSHPLSPPSPAFNLSQHHGFFQWVSSLH